MFGVYGVHCIFWGLLFLERLEGRWNRVRKQGREQDSQIGQVATHERDHTGSQSRSEKTQIRRNQFLILRYKVQVEIFHL